MSKIRIDEITIKNYRSFGNEDQTIAFPPSSYKKPVAIIGYNNVGKTNFMNSILYAVGYKWVNESTFTLKDFHNLDWTNIPSISSCLTASSYVNARGRTNSVSGSHSLDISTDNLEISAAKFVDSNGFSSFFEAKKYYCIYYINFHEIKKELSTQKTSWGNLTSFLAKHIVKIVETDTALTSKKDEFLTAIKDATDSAKTDTKLSSFIQQIKNNLEKNLRDNTCEVDFSLPDYEDIFLQMIFKIGIGGDGSKLIPIDQLGDGYISMFIMAVIQAIAESNNDDRCLFLFEEPECFLHENHQEYFYKNVLCRIASRGHQVIYTTHSDRMIDIFDTQGIIRLDFDEDLKQTIVKYNEIGAITLPVDPIEDFKQYLMAIEPNLNKILFSKKVILVEGPDDVMVYKNAIEKKVKDKCNEVNKFSDAGETQRFSETYLNFYNYAVIPHHGKTTALLLIKLCKHFGIDCFVINDWDIPDIVPVTPEDLISLTTEDELKTIQFYIDARTFKGQITNNWKILKELGSSRYHFNKPKLEGVLGFEKKEDDEDCLEYKNKGDSLYLWNYLQEFGFNELLFTQKLLEFLRIDNISVSSTLIQETEVVEDADPDDIPF